jgi:hypothetical protein
LSTTDSGVDIPIWSSIEVSTGIFCASAPCTRPLLRKFSPRFLASFSQSSAVSTSTDRRNDISDNLSGTKTTDPRRDTQQELEIGSEKSFDSQSEKGVAAWTSKHSMEGACHDYSNNESQGKVWSCNPNSVSVRVADGDNPGARKVESHELAFQYEYV